MPRSLAEHLGGTPHLSPLLRKARRLGLGTPRQLLELAVSRGCRHYAPPGPTPKPITLPSRTLFSDLELAISLCSAAQDYDPMLIRCAAQLLGSPGLEPAAIVRLARMERCEAVIRHIASAGLEADTGRENFWREVAENLPPRLTPPAGVLPHRSRFWTQTGISDPRRPQPHRQWLRPVPVSS